MKEKHLFKIPNALYFQNKIEKQVILCFITYFQVSTIGLDTKQIICMGIRNKYCMIMHIKVGKILRHTNATNIGLEIRKKTLNYFFAQLNI